MELPIFEHELCKTDCPEKCCCKQRLLAPFQPPEYEALEQDHPDTWAAFEKQRLKFEQAKLDDRCQFQGVGNECTINDHKPDQCSGLVPGAELCLNFRNPEVVKTWELTV